MALLKITTTNIFAILIAGVVLGLIIILVFFSASSQIIKTPTTNIETPYNQELSLYLTEANQFLDSGQTDQAIKKYKMILSKKPDSIGVINNLAIAYLRNNQLDRARETLEHAVSINSKKSFDNLLALYAHLAGLAYSRVETGIDIRSNGINQSKSLQQKSPPINLVVSDTIDDNHKLLVAAITRDLDINSDNLSSPPITTTIEQQQIPANEKITNNKEIHLNITEISQTEKTVEPSNTSSINEQDPQSEEIQNLVSQPSDETPINLTKTKTNLDRFIENKFDNMHEQESKIILSLKNWANAWESKNLSNYFSAYSEKFEPSNGNIDQWKEFRRSRIVPRKKIKIIISRINVDFINQSEAIVSFNQFYQADTINLRSRKKILMALENDNWKILKESIKR